MIRGFRDFILRGNVLDLAVAVIIGAAFTAIVNSLVKDIITPLIAAVVGKPDFSALTLNITIDSRNMPDYPSAFLSVFPEGSSPYTSWMNYVSNDVIANEGIATLNQTTGNFTIEAQRDFLGDCVGTVTAEAFVGKDRPHIPVELDYSISAEHGRGDKKY